MFIPIAERNETGLFLLQIPTEPNSFQIEIPNDPNCTFLIDWIHIALRLRMNVTGLLKDKNKTV